MVSDQEITVLLDGSGNCIEIEDGLVAIGSGGLYAQSAAIAMMDNDYLTAEDIARKAMHIAGDLCVYTNHTNTIEILIKEVSSTIHLKKPSLATIQLMQYLGQKYTESDCEAGLVDGDVRLNE